MSAGSGSRARESATAAAARWRQLELLQKHYRNFTPLLEDVMDMLGFNTSDVQREIGEWMEHGPQYLMVQAQRGQAKTTVAAAFCVWCLIHSPAHRILILSAAGPQANDIAILVVRIIETMDVLACIRPDKMAGDRTSYEAYDIHHSLKGVDKSASVSSVGIDSNLQGRRADLLLADDVESGKNSRTATMRAQLAHITKDFTSICSTGRILWLGTPQTLESIYNSLPARGVAVRIWPGRYPNAEQQKFYQGNLAPSIARAISIDPSLMTGGGALGDQGQAVDPVILPEDLLQKKERDQGPEYFQLQHMLNTTLMDAMKFPLKLENVVTIRSGGNTFPTSVVRGFDSNNLLPFSVNDFAFKMMRPHDLSKEVLKLSKRAMYIDPAAGGANGDESAYACGGFLSGNVFVTSAGGVPGGYDLEKMEALARKAAEQQVDTVVIEKNMGYGAFAVVFMPILKRIHPSCQLVDDLVTGQKEVRIIETLAPVIGRGALVICEEVVQEDADTSARYAPQQRQSYSLFYQMAKISKVRDALAHDDRVDALEGLVRHFQPALGADQQKLLEAAQKRAYEEMIRDPLGHNRCTRGPAARATNFLASRKAKGQRR